MRQVFRQCVRVNYNVIDVYVRKLSALRQHIVHRTLERAGCVAQSEWHDSKLVRAKFRLESGTWYMLGFDAYLVVSLLQVHLREELATAHIVEQFVNARQGILIFLRNFVQGPVVNAQALRSVLLFRKKNACAKRAFGGLNLACRDIRVNLFPQFDISR